MKDKTENFRKFGTDPLSIEAASWVAQIDAGELTDKDRCALAEWLSRSPQHKLEIRKFAALWQGVDEVIDDVLTQAYANKKAPNLIIAAFQAMPLRACASLMTASLAAVWIGMATLQTTSPKLNLDTEKVFLAEKGTQSSTVLPDGSLMYLNTDSEAEVTYTSETRTVHLVRGEAMFEVAKDVERPFEVLSDGGKVRAVGTAFVVRLDGTNMSVTVTEGKVKLNELAKKFQGASVKAIQEAPVKEALFVSEGHEVILGEMVPEVVPVNIVQIEKRIGWRHGELIFLGDDLRYVASEIERYNDISITLGPGIEGLKVGGRFKTNEVDQILGALEVTLGIESFTKDDGSIHLTKQKG